MFGIFKDKEQEFKNDKEKITWAIKTMFSEMRKGNLAELHTMRKCTDIMSQLIPEERRQEYLNEAEKLLKNKAKSD